MSFFNEKDVNVEEISRNNRIKKTITKQVASVLKSLQKEYGGTDDGGVGSTSAQAVISGGDLPSHMCHCVEAVFLHGLKKAKLRKKWSGYFGGDSGSASDSDPQTYSFWPYVIKFTHKDTVSQLKRSQHLKCEVGLCRAWVRIALNEGVLESYLSAMLADESATASYYRPVAYLRDSEQPSVLMGLLRGLGSLTFSLSANMPSLNMWTTGALAIAGIVESVSNPSPGEAMVAKLPSAQATSTIRTAAVAEPADLSAGSVGGSSWQTGIDRSIDVGERDLIGISESSSCNGCDRPLSLRKHAQSDSGGSGSSSSVVAAAAGYLHAEVLARDASSPTVVGHNPTGSVSDSFVPSANSELSSDCSSLSQRDDDAGSETVLRVYSSSGRRNPFLPLTDAKPAQPLRAPPAAAAAASWSPSIASGDGVLAATSTSANRKSSEDASGRRSSYDEPVDYDDVTSSRASPAAAAATGRAWAVPRLPRTALLEPAGNSLSSLTGWSCAFNLDDDDVDKDPGDREPGPSAAASAAAGHTTAAADSIAASAVAAPAGRGSEATPSGSPGTDTSYEDLIRGYRTTPDRTIAMAAASATTMETSVSGSVATGIGNGGGGSSSSNKLSNASNGGRGSGNGSSSGSGSSSLMPSSGAHVPSSAEATVPTTASGRQSPDSDYEVLDPYDGQPLADDLSECYGKICNEKGLDTQNYQCKACGRPVGIVYGVPRVCSFDGCYYCTECHANEEYLVPAKIIYNWDFRKFRVSKRCRSFLQSVENQPLVTVSQLNTKLYGHVPELQECRMLRIELCCLRKYLFQCAHHVAEELKRKIWPNEFLYDDPDTYSLVALTQVMSGQLAASLRKVVAFGKAHVYSCAVCQQKGFFCELCNSAKVIFPFETDVTVQCEKCHTVCHKACRRKASACPKCARIQERKKALGATDSVIAVQQAASLY